MSSLLSAPKVSFAAQDDSTMRPNQDQNAKQNPNRGINGDFVLSAKLAQGPLHEKALERDTGRQQYDSFGDLGDYTTDAVVGEEMFATAGDLDALETASYHTAEEEDLASHLANAFSGCSLGNAHSLGSDIDQPFQHALYNTAVDEQCFRMAFGADDFQAAVTKAAADLNKPPTSSNTALGSPSPPSSPPLSPVTIPSKLSNHNKIVCEACNMPVLEDVEACVNCAVVRPKLPHNRSVQPLMNEIGELVQQHIIEPQPAPSPGYSSPAASPPPDADLADLDVMNDTQDYMEAAGDQRTADAARGTTEEVAPLLSESDDESSAPVRFASFTTREPVTPAPTASSPMNTHTDMPTFAFSGVGQGRQTSEALSQLSESDNESAFPHSSARHPMTPAPTASSPMNTYTDIPTFAFTGAGQGRQDSQALSLLSESDNESAYGLSTRQPMTPAPTAATPMNTYTDIPTFAFTGAGQGRQDSEAMSLLSESDNESAFGLPIRRPMTPAPTAATPMNTYTDIPMSAFLLSGRGAVSPQALAAAMEGRPRAPAPPATPINTLTEMPSFAFGTERNQSAESLSQLSDDETISPMRYPSRQPMTPAPTASSAMSTFTDIPTFQFSNANHGAVSAEDLAEATAGLAAQQRLGRPPLVVSSAATPMNTMSDITAYAFSDPGHRPLSPGVLAAAATPMNTFSDIPVHAFSNAGHKPMSHESLAAAAAGLMDQQPRARAASSAAVGPPIAESGESSSLLTGLEVDAAMGSYTVLLSSDDEAAPESDMIMPRARDSPNRATAAGVGFEHLPGSQTKPAIDYSDDAPMPATAAATVDYSLLSGDSSSSEDLAEGAVHGSSLAAAAQQVDTGDMHKVASILQPLLVANDDSAAEGATAAATATSVLAMAPSAVLEDEAMALEFGRPAYVPLNETGEPLDPAESSQLSDVALLLPMGQSADVKVAGGLGNQI